MTEGHVDKSEHSMSKPEADGRSDYEEVDKSEGKEQQETAAQETEKPEKKKDLFASSMAEMEKVCVFVLCLPFPRTLCTSVCGNGKEVTQAC